MHQVIWGLGEQDQLDREVKHLVTPPVLYLSTYSLVITNKSEYDCYIVPSGGEGHNVNSSEHEK